MSDQSVSDPSGAGAETPAPQDDAAKGIAFLRVAAGNRRATGRPTMAAMLDRYADALDALRASGSGESSDTEVTDAEVDAFAEAYFLRGPSEDFVKFADWQSIQRRIRLALNALLASRAGSGERPEPSEEMGEDSEEMLRISGLLVDFDGETGFTSCSAHVADLIQRLRDAAAAASPNSGASGSKSGVRYLTDDELNAAQERDGATVRGEGPSVSPASGDAGSETPRLSLGQDWVSRVTSQDGPSVIGRAAPMPTLAEVLDDCERAITIAITSDEGLDGADGEGALRLIRAARVSRDGGTPPTMVERVAKAIYDAMRDYDHEGQRHPWVEGGNSLKQDEARKRAREALEPFAAAPSLSEEERKDAERLDWIERHYDGDVWFSKTHIEAIACVNWRDGLRPMYIEGVTVREAIDAARRLAGPDTPPTEPSAAAPTPEGTNG